MPAFDGCVARRSLVYHTQCFIVWPQVVEPLNRNPYAKHDRPDQEYDMGNQTNLLAMASPYGYNNQAWCGRPTQQAAQITQVMLQTTCLPVAYYPKDEIGYYWTDVRQPPTS
jgi:hypothetical protein